MLHVWRRLRKIAGVEVERDWFIWGMAAFNRAVLFGLVASFFKAWFAWYLWLLFQKIERDKKGDFLKICRLEDDLAGRFFLALLGQSRVGCFSIRTHWSCLSSEWGGKCREIRKVWPQIHSRSLFRIYPSCILMGDSAIVSNFCGSELRRVRSWSCALTSCTVLKIRLMWCWAVWR